MTIDDATAEDALTAAGHAPLPRSRDLTYWRRSWRGFVSGNKVVHRWLALVLGLLLLIETTSGAILLYQRQIDEWTGHTAESFVATPSKHPIPIGDAAAIVAKAHPKFGVDEVDRSSWGTYVVDSSSSSSSLVYVVDPDTGRILGSFNAAQPWLIQFLQNVHEEGWSGCSGGPGCITFLNHPLPGAGTVGLDGATWGSLYLGVLAFMLLYLSLSGLVLWWPGVKRFFRSFTVKVKGGRYRRDHDLHRVIGFVVIPFLFLWGITGADFALPFVGKTIYAIQGVVGFDSTEPNPPGITPKKPMAGPVISYQRAGQAALRVTHGGTVMFVYYEGASSDVYAVGVARGLNVQSHNPNSAGDASGNTFVEVDAHHANNAAVFSNDWTASSPAEWLFNSWGERGLHEAFALDTWTSIPFFIAGMMPLMLAITGISTWLYRRKRRKAAKKAGTPIVDLDNELDDPDGSLAPAPA